MSWDACLSNIAAGVNRLIDDGGLDRVGCYIGTGSVGGDSTGRLFVQKLMNALLPSDLLRDDGRHRARLPSGGTRYRLPVGVPVLGPDDDEQPALALLLGFNPVVSRGYANVPNFTDPVRRIRSCRSRDGQVWS